MRTIGFIAVLALLVPSAFSQTVRTLIDTDTLDVGGRHRVAISIRHDGAREAHFPDRIPLNVPPPPGAIGLAGDLELLSRISSGSRLLPDASQIDSVLYEMTTFAIDTAFVSAVVGLATDRDTTLFAAVQGAVPVRSIVPPDAQDIRDLAPLAEFPRVWWPWLLGLAALGFALWWFVFRNRHVELIQEEEEYHEPAEPAFDEAIRRLTELEHAAPEDDHVKPWFVELSDIVRTYVARRTSVPAREMTTGELVSRLSDRPVVAPDRVREVGQVLSVADLVKFADQRPAAERSRTVLASARRSIEQTEAEFAPPAATDAPSTAQEDAA